MLDKKSQRTIALSIQIIRLEILFGHLKWKITHLARGRLASRSRIYELMGPNKSTMVVNALSVLLNELYNLGGLENPSSGKQSDYRALMKSRKMVLGGPELLAFYFCHRNGDNEIGNLIREREKKVTERVAKSTGLENLHDILFVRTFIHGLS